ncbi:carboxypeptidase-like regulatory domain-containing protein [Mucilaginibacter limnophilus]|uniref:Carboxypeptidase-like regulatory domain-containing protein n=1 Tax=Mucilaginibacter limnophilus TaxID=1932778 RepID=A0A3S2Y2I7_9SPHI|nr:DUF5686 and carboxypeptidase-like regulatory domain-containing protein [Mucilaginibacter limnophilus]RVU00413.1 carboxypeptidase-like regulatory domain-containing protein [Mucilaginibacter limnophilus]
MKDSERRHAARFYTVVLFIICIIVSIIPAAAQNTVIHGTIRDAKTKETLPYVTVAVVGSTQGVRTDNNGKYTLNITGTFTQIQVSYVGYAPVTKNILPGREQTIDITLRTDTRVLQEIVVKGGKKKKYTNKNNPAVELIRKVIAHKAQNRMESYDYVQYRQYEKMFFSLSNLSEKFKNKRIFKNYQFLFQEQDSTAIGGKNLLPMYMEEKLSDNYYRKDPHAQKQVIVAQKQVKYDENFIDNDGLSTYFNRMYQDIDIYDNNISMLSNQILSPIADAAPTFYKFFITDTIRDQQPQLVELSFTPRNTTDQLFEGSIYITLDGNYAVENAVLSVNKNINLNFVRNMQATLSFGKSADSRYHLSASDLKIDFGINKNKGGGIFGERTVTFSDFKINQAQPKTTYEGPSVVTVPNADEKSEAYWQSNRLDTLTAAQRDIYKNIDSLQTIPAFRRTMDIITLAVAGYKNLGPFEVGPVNTFYSFNPVEGFRLRLGGRTTTDLSKRYYFETYGAYGFKDEKFKYFLSGTYSINNKSIYKFPQHYIRASFQHDTKIPGQELQFVQEDNFLLSFKRGDNDMWLYNDIFRLDYVHEFPSHFSYRLGFKKWNQNAAGGLYFINNIKGESNTVNTIRTTELSAELRYAPHEKFYQGKLYRTPIPDKYPIFTLRYTQGLNDFLGGDYGYGNLTANVSKRFYLSQFGYTDITVEGNRIFGQVPFPLLDIHRANQSYAFQFQSYNLMNFLEFVSDQYGSINIDHSFNGFIFNKIPLLKRLKWREVVNFKGLWGNLRDENNPAYHPDLLAFPVNEDGTPVTYTLNGRPYMEGSIGISNIFKLLRVDLVKRFSYLDNPDVSKLGVRFYVKFDF